MDLDNEELEVTKIIKLTPKDLRFTDSGLTLEEYRKVMKERYKNFKGE